MNYIYLLWRLFRTDKLGASKYIPMPQWMRNYISKRTKRTQIVLYARALVGSPVYRDVDPELACANVITGIMEMVDPSFFGNTDTENRINGTYTLGEELRRLEREKRVLRLKYQAPGAIVLCRTGTGNTGAIGHVGIVDLNGHDILSNNSFTHKLDRHFNEDNWKEYYDNQLGFKTEYWMVIK